MNLQQQLGEFRRLLDAAGWSVDDFELNAGGDGFRALMTGGSAALEVHCRVSGTTRSYQADGGPGWLAVFAAELQAGVFTGN